MKKINIFNGIIMLAPPVLIEKEENIFIKFTLKILGKLFPGFPLIPDMGIYIIFYRINIYIIINFIIIFRSFY
jgi:hypothetical protein